jgi:hypothetical protein
MFELAGASGLVLPLFARAATICLINAERKGVTLRGRPATPLWLRASMQVLFIGLLWWPIWGPDGFVLYFGSMRTGLTGVYQCRIGN